MVSIRKCGCPYELSIKGMMDRVDMAKMTYWALA